jgi:hypothetical protein
VDVRQAAIRSRITQSSWICARDKSLRTGKITGNLQICGHFDGS